MTVSVVQKEMGPIREDLKTVQADTAPDVIVGAHDWVGELAANGSVVPLFPSTATKKQFPAYALNAFSYGTAIKKLYGAPVALENIALVTNTKLAKVPTSFADMEKQALAVKKKTKAQVGLSVQQGSGGDAYHMYPLFSGLCGYIFGTNSAGNLDPSAIGVANPKFLKNAAADRHLEQGGPDPLERRLEHLEGPVPEGQDGVLLHRPVEPQRHPQDAGPEDRHLGRSPTSARAASRCRSSASRASW